MCSTQHTSSTVLQHNGTNYQHRHITHSILHAVTISLPVGEQCGISGEIKISSFPTPAYFVESGTMSIICGHTTELIFRYMMHPRDGIISVSTGRYVVDSDSDVEATLTVRNARQSDEGPYQCVFCESPAPLYFASSLKGLEISTAVLSADHNQLE